MTGERWAMQRTVEQRRLGSPKAVEKGQMCVGASNAWWKGGKGGRVQTTRAVCGVWDSASTSLLTRPGSNVPEPRDRRDAVCGLGDSVTGRGTCGLSGGSADLWVVQREIEVKGLGERRWGGRAFRTRRLRL